MPLINEIYGMNSTNETNRTNGTNGGKNVKYSDRMLAQWLQDHKPRAAALKDQPAFYRNLEKAIDVSRADHSLFVAKPRWDDTVLDFASSDFLYGNYNYLIQIEKELAKFHSAEAAYIAHSVFMANAGTVAAVPLPGDAIVYDDAVHASTHEGMKLSLALHQLSFRHHSSDSLREVLSSLKESDASFVSGNSSILIAVESVYSMDGDICPLDELVQVAKELFPFSNA
jgi:8-amino-7-oxononanoate synthase